MLDEFLKLLSSRKMRSIYPGPRIQYLHLFRVFKQKVLEINIGLCGLNPLNVSIHPGSRINAARFPG